ncbi:MAG: DUF262 and DUF1524 domain-containing protein [Roseovarius sp.]|nr:DUF262 and DUF1524 domain-containing protein [Roseovarius sp.]
MDARHINLLKFVRDASQFVIPIYQRKYSWEQVQCEQLWDDVIRAGKQESGGGHFIGSIVYVADTDAHNAPLLVIDGQQRLTTLTLLLAAMSSVVGEGEPLDGFSKKKLESYYLTNPLESGDMYRKLALSETDRDTLFAIVDGSDFPDNHSHRILENFTFFKDRLASLNGNLEVVCKGLSKLLVVYVALSRKEDNPQLIFESMNSTGRELSQADLIRNFVLMGLETDLQSRLYNQYWRQMEQSFGQKAYDSHFDSFMRYYLIVKTGDIPRLGDVYTAFKTYARSESIVEPGIEALVKDIGRYSRFYCEMALDKEADKDLRKAFHDIRELRVDVAYPLLLELYADYDGGELGREEFLQTVRLIESYVFRRAVCSIPTNSMNKTFATFGKSLKKDRYFESIMAQFLLMPSYRRFPSDEEFKEKIKLRDLYNFRNRSYWLRRFENYGSKEKALVDEYTIEHIMPQNVTDEWKIALGKDWERVHEKYLHTIGNLTLTGYNSEYSDKPFKYKRDMERGFAESPLKVNKGLGNIQDWNENAIRDRADELAKKASVVWGYPDIAPDVVDAYRLDDDSHSSYTADDHPNLANSKTRELFEAFRKEVLKLDPCVSEEFLKFYIAYKAETNFVDVIPLAKNLRLSLNMDFVDINDPKRLCRDVTGLGKWGNGDVDIKFSNLSELPYVIGLVRQSLERQLGNGVDA